MMISTKGRYAIRVMTELAGHDSDERIPLKDIATSQNISLKYLESIMSLLVKNNLVDGVPGKGGGYRLLRPADKYSLLEILKVTEGDVEPVSCTAMEGGECDRLGKCPTYPVWKELSDLITDFLGNKTLYDLMGEEK